MLVHRNALFSSKAPVSFNKMKKAVTDAGGIVCPSVHKKVNYLLATEYAFASRTQKVRKAIKLKVCIVRPGFLDACIAAGRKADHKPFAFDVSAAATADNEGGRKKNGSGSLPGGSLDPIVPGVLTGKDILDLEIVIPMDCYCVCHDSGLPYCDWCTEGHPELAPWPLCDTGAGDVEGGGCAADSAANLANATKVDAPGDAAAAGDDDDDDDDGDEAPMLVCASAGEGDTKGEGGGPAVLHGTNAVAAAAGKARAAGKGVQAGKVEPRLGAQKLQKKRKKKRAKIKAPRTAGPVPHTLTAPDTPAGGA